MLRENDVNCVLILLEGSDARHEPCPGIAAIRLTVSSPHQMPDDLLTYLQSGGPLTPARLALLFPRTQWVNYYLTVLVFQTPVSDRQLQSFFSSCTARLLFPFYLCRVSETELLLLASKHVLPLLTGVVRKIWPGAAHTFLSDYATEPPQLPQATLQLLKYAACLPLLRHLGSGDHKGVFLRARGKGAAQRRGHLALPHPACHVSP